jgi:predicted transcriptional regulator of viral defense system
MRFRQLLDIVQDEPVFETGVLLAGEVDPGDVRKQLSRWSTEGRVYQLRRGLYTLAPPYRKVKPHPFLVANRLVRASYVSCQSALAFTGSIPEYVPVTTSVTTARPGCRDTPLGRFDFRHIKKALLTGYRSVEVYPGQRALVAVPEKAILDLVHLQPGGDTPEYLGELRLQNLETLDDDLLASLAERLRSPKLRRAARIVTAMARHGVPGCDRS